MPERGCPGSRWSPGPFVCVRSWSLGTRNSICAPRTVIRVGMLGLAFEEKTDKGRDRRTSRDTSAEGLFVQVDSVSRLRGWVGRSLGRGRFVDAPEGKARSPLVTELGAGSFGPSDLGGSLAGSWGGAFLLVGARVVGDSLDVPNEEDHA
jgi:hypothetical protein